MGKNFIASPACIGLGYLDQSYAVRILSAPSAHVPHDGSPSLLIGSDGDSAFAARPLSLPLDDIFTKVLTIVPRRETEDLPLFALLPSDMLGPSFSTETWPSGEDAPNPIQDAIAALPDPLFSTALVPITFPLIPGHPICEGPITNARVIDGLVAYHPLLEYFAAAALFLRQNPALSMYQIAFPSTSLPEDLDPSEGSLTAPSIALSPTSLYPDGDAGIYDPHATVEARVAQVRDANVAAYLRANPGLTSPTAQHPTPSVATPITITTTATSPHASKVFEQRQPYLQLFAAAIGTDAHTG